MSRGKSRPRTRSTSERTLPPERLARALRRARARAAVRQAFGPSRVLMAAAALDVVVAQWCLACSESLSSCACAAPTPTTIDPSSVEGRLFAPEESP